jgi:hypothetical protein
VVHFTVTHERIERRANFFGQIAREFIQIPSIQAAGITFSDEVALNLAEAYFLLSESYKTYRSETEHRTADPKIAAITCATICALTPLRPPRADFDDLQIRYANPRYAMRCASVIIQHPWHKRAFEERRRTYDELLILEFPCLNNYIADVARGEKKDLELYNTKNDKFSIGITFPELSRIESLVNRFIVLKELKIYAKARRS